MTIPQAETLLPELMQFAAHLADQRQHGKVTNWQDFGEQVRAFFTPTMMGRVERVVPGWSKMASHADQQTLIHVTSVLTALRLLPEFEQATPEQQALMEWMVLFHDVAKIARHDKHDYVHGFRSAAITGKALAAVGFPVTADYPELIDGWFTLTDNAIVYRADLQETAQDNRKLPEIVSGIDRLFGVGAPAGLIIKGVLLHISVETDPEYPTVAPLTDNELPQFLDVACFPLLKVMTLVDSDGWNMFDQENRQRLRQLTLVAFNRIGTLISQ